MKICHHKLNYGFVLIDAMMAMVVVAIGLFGVAKLNSVMLKETGIAKTRAEAIHLAQEKIEQCRTKQPPFVKCESSTSETKESTFTVVNQNFTREWRVENVDVANQPAKLSVCVTWGSTCWNTDADQQDKKVELHTLLSWSDIGTGAALGGGTNTPGGGMPNTPTGVAVEGGNNGEPYSTLPSGTGVTINNDGTRIYQKSDKVAELIDDSTKRVLLTISDGSDFSSITGKVYITWGSEVDKKDESDITLALINEFVSVLGSGGSACKQFVSGGGTTLPLYPTSGTTKFSYFSYTCYMGAGWYGNIAIVRFDGGDRVCLGDPDISSTNTTPTSRRPLLNAIRNYRGYTAACTTSSTSPDCKSTGIGMSGDSYTSVHLGGTGWSFFLQHDFLLTTIKGQPTNQDCAVEEAKPTLIASPFTQSIDPPRWGNTGLLYCLSNTCPIPSGFVTFQTNFTLTLTTLATTPLVIAIDGGQCLPPTATASPFVYNCQIDWLGWSGDYWAGNLSFSKADGSPIGGSLSNVVLGTISPTGGVVTLNSTVVGCDGTCVQFDKVFKDVTSFSLSLSAP